MTMSATLTPAYGQDYKSRKAVLEAWAQGKDFILNAIQGDALCSIRNVDILKDKGFTHATFRNTRGVIMVNVPL
jgi:hypothetical protein